MPLLLYVSSLKRFPRKRTQGSTRVAPVLAPCAPNCMHKYGVGVIQQACVENLNQARSDRWTIELRFSWEGVLNHTWISPWTQKGILLCAMDPRKRSVTYVFMNDETIV